jgi:hypothetical protein
MTLASPAGDDDVAVQANRDTRWLLVIFPTIWILLLMWEQL